MTREEFLKKNYKESIITVFKERGYDFNFEVVFIDASDYMEGVDENEEDLNLPIKVLELLELFIENRGEIVTKEMIISKLWATNEE